MNCTGEAGICRGKWSFPHLAELIKDIGDLGLIGIVVHEHDHALLCENHLRQGRPVIETHGYLPRHVQISRNAGLLDWSGEIAYPDKVGIADNDSNNIVKVVSDPSRDFG